MKMIAKVMIGILVVLFLVFISLNFYVEKQTKEAISLATTTVGEVFNAATEYDKSRNRIIVNKYVEDEKELFEATRIALPVLSAIGKYDVIDHLSVRAYYGGNTEDFQLYDIDFKDIDKINWSKINTFDDFLSHVNRLE